MPTCFKEKISNSFDKAKFSFRDFVFLNCNIYDNF